METHRIRYDGQLMTRDMAVRGWAKLDLARAARVSDMAVIRFLRGERQTNRMAKRLAEALNHSVERYIVDQRQEASA